jgi:hypothetical protein
MFVMLLSDVAVAAIFYVLFEPVNRALSLIGFALRLVLVAIVGVAQLARYLPLLLLKDGASVAIGTDQVQALGLSRSSCSSRVSLSRWCSSESTAS